MYMKFLGCDELDNNIIYIVRNMFCNVLYLLLGIDIDASGSGGTRRDSSPNERYPFFYWDDYILKGFE
jgi:hypothetical protein